MSAKPNQWKLGLFVVATVTLSVATLLWVGAQRFSRETQRFHCFFDESVQGLEVGAPAKMRGVTIGTVAEISFARDRRHVDVEVDFYVDVLERLGLLPLGKRDEEGATDLRVQLATTGITGVKHLSLDFVDPRKTSPRELPFPTPTASLPTMPSTLKSIEDAVVNLTDAMPDIFETIEDLVARVTAGVDEANLVALAHKAGRVLDAVEGVLISIDGEHLGGRIDGLVEELEATLAATRRLVEGAGDQEGQAYAAIEAWTQLAHDASQVLESAELPAMTRALLATATSYRGLAVEATALTTQLHADVHGLRDALLALQALAEYLERDPGALLRGRQVPAETIR